MLTVSKILRTEQYRLFVFVLEARLLNLLADIQEHLVARKRLENKL